MRRSNASEGVHTVSSLFFLPFLGAAYLVIHRMEKKKYIAKQIML
jgi:hypothetical protein